MIKDGCYSVRDNEFGSLWVEIGNGRFRIQEDFFSGPLERERWYEVDEKNTELLFGILLQSESGLIEIITEKFSGKDGLEDFSNFCKENGVECKYNTYSSMN